MENEDGNGARAFQIFDHGRLVEKNCGDIFFSDPMATYFHGNSETQPPDGLQTLILMNPGYIHYSDTPPPASSNLVFFNSSAGNPLYLPNLPHAPPSQPQHLVGIPLSDAASSDPNSLSSHSHHDVSPLHGFIQRSQNRFCSSNDHLSTVARDSPRPKQGLSLTLSSHHPGYGLVRIPSEAQQEVSGDDEHIAGGSSSASGVSLPAVRSISLSSKYLRVAQELLDEVANVGNNGVNKETLKKADDRRTKQEEESSALARDNKDGVEVTAKNIPELSAAERQEIQMKAAKFINMLDEVEQRYRQYHHQMQILVSSFEQAVGIGSARTYTALALHTISKQFRCLKDTINAQIRVANNNLGKQDCHGSKLEGSKLRFVDHQFHQQRALQNLGMIQQNAWRPQRGLPERSVSVLRAWLFEHFLHPYPKDSDKQMLAKQTGLTRSQVSNWFINARVRLWKPMVEDMYMEEIKEQEQNLSADKTIKNIANTTSKSTTTPQDKNHAIDNQLPSFNSKQEDLSHLHPPPAISFSSSATSLEAVNVQSQSGFWLNGSSELDGITQGSPKRQRIDELMQSPNSIPINIDAKPGEANNEHISMNFNRERHGRDGYSFIGGQANFIGGFQQYPITDIERYDAGPFTTEFSGNGVSLTLGLPRSENITPSVANHTFLPNQNINVGRNSFDLIDISTPHSTSAFGSIDVQNRKRLVAQLLPDFVT